ncbi:MAG: tyrosine-type recombinase/integrase [Clostridia bacterium]|nr:tyrosine-type recombinase/integrase [Clostridia bacterium]
MEKGYESLRYQCQMACKEAGITYHGLHVFRHTFAMNHFYKGTNVKILSKILGHSETSVTFNIYIHLYGDGFDDMLSAVS